MARVSRAEIKALGTFCELERELQDFVAANKELNRELTAARGCTRSGTQSLSCC